MNQLNIFDQPQIKFAPMPPRHAAIIAMIKRAGTKGMTGEELRNGLHDLGMGSADVARDISDCRRRFGLPKTAIECRYIGKTDNGSSLSKWYWNCNE